MSVPRSKTICRNLITSAVIISSELYASEQILSDRKKKLSKAKAEQLRLYLSNGHRGSSNALTDRIQELEYDIQYFEGKIQELRSEYANLKREANLNNCVGFPQ